MFRVIGFTTKSGGFKTRIYPVLGSVLVVNRIENRGGIVLGDTVARTLDDAFRIQSMMQARLSIHWVS